MTCKDCLYHERCHSEIAYGMGSDDLTGEYFTDIEARCTGFKNKADFVEVKHGKWKEHFDYDFWFYDCPFCYFGFAIKIKDEDPPNYCENCGAKMDLKEGAEE